MTATATATEQARRLRRWARLLRDNADNPEVYRKSLLHTIERRPGEPPQERYCALGLMIQAAHPENTPHDLIWEQTDTLEDGAVAVYSERNSSLEQHAEAETVELMGLYPEGNPFAMTELPENDPTLQQWDAPDLAFVPMSMIPDPEEILEYDRGLAQLNNDIYITLASLSDAGQQH